MGIFTHTIPEKIIDIEKRENKVSNIDVRKKMRDEKRKLVEEEIDNFLKTIDAAAKELKRSKEEAYVNVAARGTALSHVFKHINDLISMCAEGAVLREAPIYDKLVKLMGEFGKALIILKRHILNGDLVTKESVIIQYNHVVTDFRHRIMDARQMLLGSKRTF